MASSDSRSLVRVALYAPATVRRHADCYMRNALAGPFAPSPARVTWWKIVEFSAY